MASGVSTFRQVDEKHVLLDIEHMLWSPKMDLIAIANVAGEVILHRLSWQKVWTLSAINEDTKVVGMAWRPDGKVIAVGYSSGLIRFCDVEDSSCLHSAQCSSSVSFMSWCNDSESNSSPNVESTENLYGMQSDIFEDQSEKFLPRLTEFAKTNTLLNKDGTDDSVSAEDAKKLQGQKSLNVLFVGTVSGELELFAYGVFSLGVIDMQEYDLCKSGTGENIVSAVLTSDFKHISVAVERENSVDILTFASSRLSQRKKELKVIAVKFGTILSLVDYMETTISQMEESWEDILLEMDAKLVSLAEQKFKVCGGSVSRDFLRLLMFGRPSEELSNLLQFELTDKKLKKLGSSIETSYLNIQRLLQKHLQAVGQTLVYHLTDLRGLAESCDTRWRQDIGLDECKVGEAVRAVGSFMLKTVELQQVIDGSLKDFKAFFRWLYLESQRLCSADDSSTAAAAQIKMTQQDLKYVAHFLRENFVENHELRKSGFHLEKVGQYLKNADLQHLVSTEQADTSGTTKSHHANSWRKVVAESSWLSKSPLLYKVYPDKSLIQVQHMLKQAINGVLQACTVISSKSYTYRSRVVLTNLTSTSHVTSSINSTTPHYITSQRAVAVDKQDEVMYTACVHKSSPSVLYICRISYTSGSVEVAPLICKSLNLSEDADISDDCMDRLIHTHNKPHFTILDLAFYDNKTLSLLLQEPDDNNRPVLLQLPLTVLTVNELFHHVGLISVSESLTNSDDILSTISDPPVLRTNEPDKLQSGGSNPTELCAIDVSLLTSRDFGPLVTSSSTRVLDNVKASRFAVSGTRKVTCVLLTSRRRVRLFLLDVEEEESTLHASQFTDVSREDNSTTASDNNDQ